MLDLLAQRRLGNMQFFRCTSEIQFLCNCNELTLPWLKPTGFLIQRLTLKCSVLAAILKPFNRGDTTN
jgi:hypothetical protein